VLFTDIVGSTERAAALGDRRWRDVLVSHNAIVRRELQRFRGREVKTVPARRRWRGSSSATPSTSGMRVRQARAAAGAAGASWG
jgi:hypothetical protein